MNVKDKFKDLFDFSYELTTIKLHCRKIAAANDIAIGAFHYNRIKHLLLGIIELCSNGLFIESQILLRSPLNLLINIKWINLEDSENRKQRYIDFEIVFKKKASESTYRFDGILIDNSTTEYKQSEIDFNNVLSKYHIKNYKTLGSWSPKKIRQMAEDVNLEWEYEVMYSRLSEYEHCGPSSIVDYYEDNEVTFGPKLANLPIILIGSCDYYLYTLEEILKMMNCLFTDITYSRFKLDRLALKYLSA
jgi:hypothetical protein